MFKSLESSRYFVWFSTVGFSYNCHFYSTENYTVGSSEVKSESAASLQPQTSVTSLPTGSPGPKRSGTTGNTLKKWLTSPVRRLSHGKGDNANSKKPNNKQRKRDGRKSVELGPQHQDSTEEVCYSVYCQLIIYFSLKQCFDSWLDFQMT